MKAAGQWVTILPHSLMERLQRHLERVREVHEADRAEKWPGVMMQPFLRDPLA